MGCHCSVPISNKTEKVFPVDWQSIQIKCHLIENLYSMHHWGGVFRGYVIFKWASHKLHYESSFNYLEKSERNTYENKFPCWLYKRLRC